MNNVCIKIFVYYKQSNNICIKISIKYLNSISTIYLKLSVKVYINLKNLY